MSEVDDRQAWGNVRGDVDLLSKRCPACEQRRSGPSAAPRPGPLVRSAQVLAGVSGLSCSDSAGGLEKTPDLGPPRVSESVGVRWGQREFLCLDAWCFESWGLDQGIPSL